MKNKLLVLLGSFFISISAISLVIQIIQVKAWYPDETVADSFNKPDQQSIDGSGWLQAGSGTATLAYYLPLIKADAPLTTPTPTPTHTPTATQIVTWYGEGIYDDIFPGIEYSQDWHAVEGSGRFHGTLRFSAEEAGEAMFHFAGGQVSVFYSKDANRGDMEVWIDGVWVDTIDQYALDLTLQNQWNSPELVYGNHTLVLRHASGSWVDLDALVVSAYPYPPGQGVAPLFSNSYYMNTIDSDTLYDLGCETGLKDYDTPGWQDSLVVLDFGMPRVWDGNYGASLFGLGPATTAELRDAVIWFGVGYYACSFDEYNSHLRVGIGTSNYYNGQVTYNHGRQWALMVNQVNDFFEQQGLLSRVDAVGANDMELGWNTPEITRAWVNGYSSAFASPLYNFGDAAGCPTDYLPGWTCNGMGDWTQEDVWYISYGAPPSYPLPLIYADSGVNAHQWQYLSQYGYDKYGVAMEFQGEMTQYQSCLQLGGCGTLDNTPSEGWTFLWEALKKVTGEAQYLRYSTDILYIWR